MKTIAAQVAMFLQDPEARTNLRLLGKIILIGVGVVLLNTILFHLLMFWEGQQHSFLSGLYWTLVTMSTLGFGDIVFETDLGRMFSVYVILSGITLLLVVLPFAFIQFFYAPWLQTQLRLQAPRALPPDTRDHVIICQYDEIGQELVERLGQRGLPYVVIVPDPQVASAMKRAGVADAVGEADDVRFLDRIRVANARLVFANRSDEENTNIALTVREVAPDVPIAAVAAREASHDILELSGVTRVLPLKRWLGEQLANRVAAAHAQSHVIGHYRDLMLAEVPVRNTPLAGKTVRETRLRQITGVSIVGIWIRGRLNHVRPDLVLSDNAVAVVAGTQEQLENLDEILLIYNVNPNPILVIGGGRVGRSAARAIRDKDLSVHILERDATLCARLREDWRVFEGDAADLTVLTEAGIREAPAVVLSTHDDATNIYLASYCRRLNPEMRIVSRITHQRNVEAVNRAGADFVLSYTELGAAAVMAEMDRRQLTLLGGDLELYAHRVPHSLIGRTLAESEIGARTGMLVLAIEHDDQVITNPSADTVLHADARLVMIGDDEHDRRFERLFKS